MILAEYNFRRMLEKVENGVSAINHLDQENRRTAPWFIMIIDGLIKTLRYNASG